MKKNNLNQELESFLILSSYKTNMTLSENFSSVKVITEPTKTMSILSENTIVLLAKDALDNVLNPFFKGLSQTIDQAGNQIVKVAGREISVAQGFLDDVTRRIDANASGWWDDLSREAANGSTTASKTMDDLLKIIDADPNISTKAFQAFEELVKNKHAADASSRSLTQWAIDIYTLTQRLNKTTEQVIDELFVDNKLLGRTLKNGLSKEVNNLDDTTKEAVRAMLRSGGKLSAETFKGVVYQYAQWVAQTVQMARVYLLRVVSKNGKQTIEQELKDLVARIATKVVNPNKQAVSNVDTELREMFDVLQGAKMWMSETYDQLAYKYFLDNKIINSLPEYQKLLQDEPELAKILHSGRLSAKEAATEIFMTSMRAQFGLIWPSTREIIVKNAAGKELSKTVVNRWENWFGRWMNVAKRGSPLYTNEARYINTLGGPAGWAMDQFIINAIIIHTGLAVFEDLVSNAINNVTRVEFVKSDIEEQINLLCNPQKRANADGIEETMPQALSSEQCEEMRKTLESLKAPAVSSLSKIWSDELDEYFGVQGLSLEEDFDWRKVVPITKIDNLTANIYDGLVIAATYDESVWESMKGQWKNWVLEKSLNNDNFKQMYESLKTKGIDITNLETIIESTSKTVQKDAEKIKQELKDNFYTKHPKLKNWTDASFGTAGVQWSGDEQIKVKGSVSQKEWTGKKIDGEWQWLMPDGTYKDMGEGENPDKAPTQTNTGQMNSSGILTSEKAQEIGFDLNRVLTEFRKSDENVQVYQTTDNNKVLIYYGGKTYASSKVGDDAWVYDVQPSTYVYPPNPQRVENTGTNTGGQDQNQNQNNNSSGKGIVDDSYINRKKLITKVNPKTLKESIRNKVLLKHEDKKLKIKKINENLRKFEEQFYYENYNKFFNKMFKLAESYKKSKLYLTEDDNVAFDEALLKSGLFRGQEDRMKKEFCNYVCAKLKLDGELRDKFEEKIKDYPFENIGQLFTDSEKVADMIYKSFIETLPSHGEEPTNFITAIKSTIKPYLKTADFERNFKSTLTDLSNPVMDKARKKVDVLVDKIKELLSKEDSKS